MAAGVSGVQLTHKAKEKNMSDLFFPLLWFPAAALISESSTKNKNWTK